MAAKTVPSSALLKPAVFSSQLENELQRKTSNAVGNKDSGKTGMHLIPPSKYTSGKRQEQRDNPRVPRQQSTGEAPSVARKFYPSSKDDVMKPSRRKLVSSSIPNETVKIPSDFEIKQESSSKCDFSRDSSVQLLLEIQSCKSQNEKLHQELISLLAKISSEKSKEITSADFKTSNDAHKQNFQFHDLVETKVQKQADAIDRVMQQFLNHQAELDSSNEKLSRRLLRMQEEHREVQLHLEKQLDFKEKQCIDYKKSMQRTENELQELNAKYRSEMSSLQSDLKLKNELCAALEETIKSKDKDFHNLQNIKQQEIELFEAKTYSMVHSLEEALSKCQEEYRIEKQEHEEEMAMVLQKDGEVAKIIESKDQEIKEIMVTLDKKNNQIRLLNISMEEKHHEHLKYSEELRLEMQKKLDNMEKNCIANKSECENLLENEKQILKGVEEKFVNASKELERSRAEVKGLHAYIAEKELECNSSDLRLKVKMLGDENIQLRETCKSLESAVELLNVRLVSLTNIMKIQETELSKDGIHIADQKSVRMLSKWRDKVYDLLVQLKTREILENEDIERLKNDVKNLQKQSQTQSSEILLLENQIAEKNADLKIKSNKLHAMSRETAFLKEKQRKQEEMETSFKECNEKIIKCTVVLKERFDKELDKVKESLTLFRSFEGRISFADKRLCTIQDLFQRKDIIWQSKLGNIAASKSEDEKNCQELSIYDKQSLLAEIKSLTEEREILRSKIKADSEKIASFEKNLEAEYKGLIEEQNDEIKRLHEEIEVKSKCTDEMKMALNILKEERNEIKAEKERVENDTVRLEKQHEKELTQKLDAEKEHYSEELSKMERIVSDTKREHTKAIASMQQLERQLQWQKQNSETLLKENEEAFQYEVYQLKRKAREFEKERNILMTTLKQENIKIPRLKHIGMGLPTGDETDKKPIDPAEARVIKNSTSMDAGRLTTQNDLGKDNTKLYLMMKELQSISASLLKEDQNPSETGNSENEENTSDEF